MRMEGTGCELGLSFVGRGYGEWALLRMPFARGDFFIGLNCDWGFCVGDLSLRRSAQAEEECRFARNKRGRNPKSE
jgi:hypothetical protein